MTERYSEQLGMNIRIYADRIITETGATYFKRDYDRIEKLDITGKKNLNNIMSVFGGEIQ